MTAPHPYKTHIGNHELHPETLMLNYGYDPELSEGAVKPPVFLTSTFVFKSAEEGRDFFDFVWPQGTACWYGGRAGLFSLQSPQQRDRRGQTSCLRAHRKLRGVFVRHVGDCHDLVCFCATR
jgi:hypothetical protein